MNTNSLASYPGDPVAEVLAWTTLHLETTPDADLAPLPWVDFRAQPACTVGKAENAKKGAVAGAVTPADWTRTTLMTLAAALERGEDGYDPETRCWPQECVVRDMVSPPQKTPDGRFIPAVWEERVLVYPDLTDPVDALKLLTAYRDHVALAAAIAAMPAQRPRRGAQAHGGLDVGQCTEGEAVGF